MSSFGENFEDGKDKLMPIAIVGIACRFPGEATNPKRFWDMLVNGRSSWSELPPDRFNIDAYYHPHIARQGTLNTRSGNFLKEDVALFDAPFFSITANEAEAMDPQQRMLLELAFESLENAGIPMDRVVGSETSCYVGAFTGDYENIASKDINNMKTYQALGAGRSILSNRLSWFYDLHGPSLTLDTACSSSLVAFHLACQSIRTGESNMSLVGGTNLILLPELMRTLSVLHFLSPDGKCFTFDHRANGYSRGEGSSVMILKPLDAALRDGDTIRAVVRGSGVNQDGKTPGITLPSLEAQAQLIRNTYRDAGLPLSDTDYFEAHGTGTSAGDPLEVGAIGKTFGVERNPSHPLHIGSVKANVGHLEGCSGLAGILKTVLLLEAGLIPPQANFERVNPNLHLENLSIPVSPVNMNEGLRRASINSFGYGGTNAHVILDDAFHYLKYRGLEGNHHTKVILGSITPSTNNDSGIGSDEDSPGVVISTPQGNLKILIFSSPEQNGLQRIGKVYSEHLKELKFSTKFDSYDYVRNLAHTLSSRRSIFAWRTFAISDSTDSLLQSLDEGFPKFSRSSKLPKLGFVFTGQGAQWFAMGRELLTYRIFSDVLIEADEYLRSLGCSWSVLEELRRDETSTHVNETRFSQPLCTILQVALVELTKSWGIEASRVVGHSSGEIGAAYCIGALTKQDAWKIAYFRGLLSADIKNRTSNNSGAMIAVGISREQAESYLAVTKNHTVVVACINSPSNTTLSGDKVSILELATRLRADNIQATILKVDIAYHSPHMNQIANDYLVSIQDIKPIDASSTAPMFSSVTGQQIACCELGPSYWVQNLVSPVNFLGAVNSMLAPATTTRRRNAPLSVDVLLEFGPHAALQGPLKQILGLLEKDKNSVHYIPILRRGRNAALTSLEAAGKLWCRGYKVNFDILNSSISDFVRACPLVDLPNYPWNHNNRYWHESTTSHNRRFNERPRLDLLGKPVENFNPHEPSWLNVLHIFENPWIQDHVVQGSVLFPAAGMLVMAIEAAKQLSDKDKKVEGYELRDIAIGHALVLQPSDTGVETMLQIRPHRIGTRANTSTWLAFKVFSLVRGEAWVENCSGLISIKYETASSEVERGLEAEIEWKSLKKEFNAIKEGCTKQSESPQFYKRLGEMGLQFGPLFQNVTQINTGKSIAFCSVRIPDTKSAMPEMYEYDHLIHPATLDAFIQTIFATISGSSRLAGAMVPTSIDSVFVSANFPKTAGTELTGFTKSTSLGQRESAGFVTFSDISWNSPMIIIKGLKCTELASMAVGNASEEDDSSKMRKICAYVEWKQDVEHLSHSKEQALLIKDNLPADKDRAMIYNRLEKVSVFYMRRALAELRVEVEDAMSPHLKLYLAWMRRQYMQAKEGALDRDGDSSWLELSHTEEDELMIWAREESLNGKLMCAIGENLLQIFSGEIDPLSLMMEDNMLIRYYSESVGISELNNIVGLWFDKAGHKNPNIRVLEIGGGSASASRPVLDQIGGHDGSIPRLEKYVFTDISTGFFPSAQTVLAEWSSLVEYKALDIEQDPEEQGFETGSFDVILASNVLHATRSLDNTLSHCKKLLKPGGQIVIMEFTRPANNVSLIYGTLKGWWLGEDDDRKFGPIVGKSEWDKRLKANGFNGVEFSLQDTGAFDTHLIDVMVSKVPLSPPEETTKRVIVLQPLNASSDLLSLGANLSNDLRLTGFIPTIAELADLESVSDVKDSYVISLLEIEQPLFANWSSDQFAKFKTIALHSSGLLWVTKGGGQMGNTTQPEANIAIGLIRVIRAETPHLHLPTLDISDELILSSPDATRCVSQVFNSVFVKGGLDFEYAEFGSSLHTPRITEEMDMNKVLTQLTTAPAVTNQPLHQENRHLKLEIGVPGMLDTLRFVDDPDPFTPLGPREVEFAVDATALNFRDIMISMAQISNTGFGSDCAGRVIRIGNEVTRFKIGQMVYTFAMGSYRTTMRCPEDIVQAIPENMSPETAASFPTTVSTAYFSLFETARLERGETILIHAAAGGLGQIAIQLAQHLGAIIYATVGSMAKKELLMEKYGIPEDHIFNSRDLTFAKGVMRVTHNRGVDVVLNSLSGEALRQTLLCVAPFGRFIEVGKRDIYGNTGLDMAPFLKNITFGSVNLEEMQFHPKKIVHVFSKSAELIETGIVRAVYPTTILNFSETEKAFRTMQTGKHTGKLVMKANHDDMVPCMPPVLHPLKLDSRATYVLVGGLGGLGRSIANWMVTEGARNIVFISRSGGTGDLAIEILTSLRREGVNTTAYACDICEPESLQKVVDQLASEWPPIKGLIQGAMVLKDVIFENMTYEDWLTTTRPKIQGSWNLHNLFPKRLDFFILLSSTAGVIGNPGQGNYCAGNTYQDALAQYRRINGFSGTAIDLGAMKDVGWLAEHKDVKIPLMEIYEEELHLLVSSAMTGYTQDESRMPPQMIIGLGSGSAQEMNDVTMWWLQNPKFWHLKKADARASSAVVDTADTELRLALSVITSFSDGVKAIESGLVLKLAKSMMISPEDINVERPISTYGVDSLVAVEVRNWIFRELKADVSVFDLLSQIPISALALKLGEKSKLIPQDLKMGHAGGEELEAQAPSE